MLLQTFQNCVFLNFLHFFGLLFICQKVQEIPKWQKKTSNQKSAGNLIFVILISSNTNSYIFCALIPERIGKIG